MDNDVPQAVKELIIQCWDQDPKKRPDFDSIILKKLIITVSINDCLTFKSYC